MREKIKCEECNKLAEYQCDNCDCGLCEKHYEKYGLEFGDECPYCEPPRMWSIKRN